MHECNKEEALEKAVAMLKDGIEELERAVTKPQKDIKYSPRVFYGMLINSSRVYILYELNLHNCVWCTLDTSTHFKSDDKTGQGCIDEAKRCGHDVFMFDTEAELLFWACTTAENRKK